MRAYLMAAAGAASLLGGCTTAPHNDGMESVAAISPSSPLGARGYMAMAASSDMFEIESSRMALSRSRDPAVRQFAQMMIDEHDRASFGMLSLARRLDLPPPPAALMPHHREMLERLAAAPPDGFDVAYKNEQLMAHEEALNLHRNFAGQGDPLALRTFAAQSVPVIQRHWDHAGRLPEGPSPAEAEPQPEPIRRSGERG